MAAILIVSLCPITTSAASAAPPPGPEQTFESLGQAVEAGVVERSLAERLYKGQIVPTLAVLEIPSAIEAYGDGNPDALKKAHKLFGGFQATVVNDLKLPVEQRFSLLPVLLTPLRDPAAALRLINHHLVVSLWADGLNELWLGTSLARVGQPMAIQGNLKGAGQSIAILDTGADPAKPGLSRIRLAFEAAPDDGQADSHGHGSAVAGIVAAAVPDAQVIPIDIMDGTSIWDSHTLRGLNWVLANRYQQNIVAVNISWGKDNYFLGQCTSATPFHGAFQALTQARTMPIVAAGNHAFRSGSFRPGVAIPACVPGAVAVGGTYPAGNSSDEAWPNCTDKAPVKADTMTCSSANGPRIDIVAPGANISTAGTTLNGTSAAAPHVAALSAILSSINPYATAPQLKNQLRSSGVFAADPNGIDQHPRLNFPDAIRAAAPVPNDDRANATYLSTWSGRLNQTTWAASKEPGEPDHAGNAGGGSVWFQWYPDRTGAAEFSTTGSDFNTLLAVYRVEPDGTRTLLGENDDAGIEETSIVTVHVQAGDHIELAADGLRFTGIAYPRSGRLRLNWNLANDDIRDAVPFFSYGSARFGSNVGATKQGGEPHHCGDQYSTASVWYTWTPNSAMQAQLRATGTQLLCVHVYEAAPGIDPASFGMTPIRAAADDYGYPIDFTFPAQAGKVYWIAVDGVSHETACYPNGQCQYTTPTGTFTLTLG